MGLLQTQTLHQASKAISSLTERKVVYDGTNLVAAAKPLFTPGLAKWSFKLATGLHHQMFQSEISVLRACFNPALAFEIDRYLQAMALASSYIMSSSCSKHLMSSSITRQVVSARYEETQATQ